MALNITHRWQAFGIHLGISVLLFIAMAAVIFFIWYPGFLFVYDGGLSGMTLLAGVDFFIGPVLTLIVYQAGKKSLKFDLSCIAVLQLACLCGGMWAVGSTRPVAVIYATGTYITANRHSFDNQKIDIHQIALLQQSWPVYIGVDIPEESESSLNKIWNMMGSTLQYNIDNYVSYQNQLPSIAKHAQKAGDIQGSPAAMVNYQSAHPDVRFLPMTTSLYEGYVAVDVASGKILDFFKTE